MNKEKKRRGWSRRDMVGAGSIATVAGVIGRSTPALAARPWTRHLNCLG